MPLNGLVFQQDAQKKHYPRYSKRSMEFVTILILFGLIILFVKVFSPKTTELQRKLPPSIDRFPVLGNAHLLFGSKPHKLFHDIARNLGPVITFWIGKKPLIVVNEINFAREALLKRDKSFAGRPQRYTGSLYSRQFKGIIVADYGDNWKETKKLAHFALGKCINDGGKMDKIIRIECENLIQRLKLKSDGAEAVDICLDIKLTVLNVICALCFGRRYEPQDPEFKRIVQANDWFIEGITCSSVVDAFPFLRFLPLRKLCLLKAFLKVRDEILERKLEEHNEKYNGKKPSDLMDLFMSSMTENRADIVELSKDDKIMLVSDLFIAGADTTTSTLLWAFLYLAKWPDKQCKLHEELDNFLKQRDPEYKDKENMPYLQATISEVLRLSSLTPLSVPRKTTESTRLDKFSIPKNTTVIFNMYAMNHDEKIWPKPYNFEPERFIGADGTYCPLKHQFMPFSGGQRMCIGEKLAKMMLFLIISHVLKNFKLSCFGSLELEGINGVTLKPKPFKLLMKKQ